MNLPSDIGFVVINAETVLLHWGKNSQEHGALYRSVPLAKQLRHRFELIEIHAETVRPLSISLNGQTIENESVKESS